MTSALPTTVDVITFVPTQLAVFIVLAKLDIFLVLIRLCALVSDNIILKTCLVIENKLFVLFI